MTVKVSPKYQVVIPEEVRHSLGIKAGAQIEVIAKGRVAYLVPLVSMDEMKKALKSKLNTQNLRDKKDKI